MFNEIKNDSNNTKNISREEELNNVTKDVDKIKNKKKTTNKVEEEK